MNKKHLVLFLLLISQVSFAQKKKTVGELLKQVDRGGAESALEKNKIAIPQAEDYMRSSRTRQDLEKVKPPRSASFFKDETDDKAKLDKLLNRQISEMYKLTQKFSKSPRRGEMWLRLAELYVEKAGTIDFLKQNDYDEKLKAFQAGKIKQRPKLDLKLAREYNKKAIQLYEYFIRDFPKDDKVDQALFFLGFNYYELGDVKNGTKYYTRLTKDHPDSSYITEANFALAEYYFENEEWKPAKEYYSKILKNKNHRLFTFSLYKSAWCSFRLGKQDQALKEMELLVRRGKAYSGDEGTGKRINTSRLEQEGLRDIVVFYAEAGDPSKAIDYFKDLADEKADSFIERLAYIYGDKGNLNAARRLFAYMIDSNPTSAKAFDYKYQLVQWFSSNKNSQDFKNEVYSWIQQFGKESEWYAANKNNKAVVDNAEKIKETTLRNYVLQQHQTAQNSRGAFSQKAADEGYKIYLAEYPNSPTIGDMRFYYGELLYDMKKFAQAAEQYRWVADHPKSSKYADKAGENIVLTLEKDVPREDEISKMVGSRLDAVPFSDRVQRFVDGGKWYITQFPNAKRVVEIKFRIGRLHYQHNQFDEALAVFKDIIAKHPNTKYSEYSANLMLDIFNLKKDYAGLEQTGKSLLALPAIANSKAGADIRGVLEKASFKKGQDLELAKDYKGSAEYFEGYALKNPNSNLTVPAFFNAAINYERAGENQKAVENHTRVLAAKDNPDLKKKSRRILAKLSQDSGKLAEAASLYKNSAEEHAKEPVQASLYFNSALLFEAVGSRVEAEQMYLAYASKAKAAEVSRVNFLIAEMYRKAGDNEKARRWYITYLNGENSDVPRMAEANYRLYESGQNKQKYGSQIVSLFKRQRNTVTAAYAAKVQLDMAVELFNEFKRINIPRDPQAQQKAAEKKISMLIDLNKKLGEIIKLDSPEEIVGALGILGQANLHMADALNNAPLPAGLTPEQTKEYKTLIGEKAKPFFDKGKDSLMASVTKASDFEAYGPYYIESRKKLAEIDPQVYSGSEKTSAIRAWSYVR